MPQVSILFQQTHKTDKISYVIHVAKIQKK